MDEAPKIDYRALLVKYMTEVMSCEGISFVGNAFPTPIDYAPEELAELQQIEKEAREQL